MKNIFKKMWLLLIVAALCLSIGFSGCGNSDDETEQLSNTNIRIATKNTPEQNILAHLTQILIREKIGCDAEIVYFEDSTSATLLDKMDKGNIHIFFDYTGSLAEYALDIDLTGTNIPTLILDVQNTVKKNYDITVSEKIGYNSTTAFYMMIDRREELGRPTNLTKVAELSPELKIGMNEAFYTRIDCYEALCAHYGMEFKEAKVYEDDEQGFTALIKGDIDVYIGPSVTPYFSLLKVKQIPDDQYFFLPQNTCCLMSNSALEQYPELDPTMEHLEGLISESRMSLMIKRIYWEGHDIEEYLYTYLRANNII